MAWIGRKSYTLINDDNKSTSTPRNSKKKLWKYIILGFFLLIITTGAWIGYTSWQAIKNITSGSSKKTSFFQFLGNNRSAKLEGENKDRINILLIGMGGKGHKGGTLSDTIILMSIKPKENKVAFLSIPRDFYAKLPNGSYGKINAVHSQGEAKKTGGGAIELSKSVSQITGQPVEYYIRGDFEGFKKIVDTLGGVTVNVEKEIYDPYYPDERLVGYSPFRIKSGIQVMNGPTALKYARSRETTSDFDRAKRQQQLIVAMKDKATSIGIVGNPKKIVDLIKTVGDHLLTNFSPDELVRVVEVTKNVDNNKIKQVVLTNGPDGVLTSSSGGPAGYVLKPKTGDYSQIQQIAKNIFELNSEKKVANSDNSSIEVQNATGQSGYASDVARVLTGYGYKASPYLQTVTPISETVIYDYTKGKKKQTAEFLTNKFNARKIEKTSTTETNTDFTLILGTDYLTLLKQANN